MCNGANAFGMGGTSVCSCTDSFRMRIRSIGLCLKPFCMRSRSVCFCLLSLCVRSFSARDRTVTDRKGIQTVGNGLHSRLKTTSEYSGPGDCQIAVDMKVAVQGIGRV